MQKYSLVKLFNPMCRWMTRHSARILMYHQFSPDGTKGKLTASVFEQQIQFLVRYYRPCRMDQLVVWLQTGEPLPANLVIITVDDGYENFFKIAYPILKRYNVPATIYIVTRFVNQTIWLWFDMLKYQLNWGKRGSYVFEIAGNVYPVLLDDDQTRQNAWHQIADACLPLTQNERMTTLNKIGTMLDVKMPDRPAMEFRAMTWDELRQLDPELIEVGSHTCSHPILTRCSGPELEIELVESKTTIERELGCKVLSFCYPNGQPHDYDARVMSAVQAASYTSAVVAHGTCVEIGANRFALERISAPYHNTSFQYIVDSYPYLLKKKQNWIKVWS